MNEQVTKWLFHDTLGRIVFTLSCIIVLWILIRFIRLAITNRVKDNDRRYRSKKLIGFTGYILSFIIILAVYSSRINNLTVALGIAGAGIAFALQEVIASMAGWIAVMLGGFYKTGDRVQLGGIKGDVIDIGVLRTTVMEIGQWVDADLYNGRIVRIANSFVFKEPVFNYSADFPFVWDEIKIPIQYGSDYEKTKEIFVSLALEICGKYSSEARHTWESLVRKYLVEDASTEPMVTLVANDNWVEYTIRYTVDYKKRRSTKDRLFNRILSEISKTGKEIRIASATVQLVNTPEMHIRVRDTENR
jgi:small-conductance mechanosensitive channel